MADINKELNNIKNAVYGRDVRGSIHDGIKKINDESEDSKQKAEQAHDVMETIMNEGFDNAALESNFEQKLDDKIANLQPEWTQFKENTETQLAQTAQVGFKQSLVNHKGNTAKVLWIDDDGHKGVYTKLAPLLREYGIVMSAGIITNRPHGFPIAGLPAYDPNSQFMSYAQMKELEDEGIVEFIPHSHTHDINHRLTDMTVEEMHEELSTCKDIFIKLGWNYRDFVYPFGAENEQVHEVTRQYFRSAIDIGGGIVIPPFNQFKIPRVAVDGDRTAQEVIDQIDDAIDLNTLAILTTHVDQYGGLDEQKMRDIIEHVQSRGVEFVTASEAINEFGNLLQINNDSIDFKGNIHSRRIGVYRNGHIDYTSSPHINNFDKGTVTRLKIRTFHLSDFDLPEFIVEEGKYGYIHIHRDETEDSFSFMEFINVDTGRVLINKWNNASNWWSGWVYTTGEITLPSNSVKASDGVDKYPKGIVSTVYINDNNANGFPDNIGGTIKTHRLTSDDSGVYQTLDRRNYPIRYRRDWSAANNSWGDFYLITTTIRLPDNSVNFNSIPANFPLRVESIVTITDNNANGFPGNIGGILRCFRLSQDNSFIYQKYKKRNTNEEYIRTWSASGWSAFEL